MGNLCSYDDFDGSCSLYEAPDGNYYNIDYTYRHKVQQVSFCPPGYGTMDRNIGAINGGQLNRSMIDFVNTFDDRTRGKKEVLERLIYLLDNSK